MTEVVHLKAISLKAMIDLVWNALEDKTEDNKHSLEINWNMEFLPSGNKQKESPLFSTAFIANSKIGLTQHSNFYTNKLKLEVILDYFNIPDSLKIDIVHVMKNHYKSPNLFHKVFMIEMGLDFFHIQGYLHSPSFTFTLIDMLTEAGKKKIKKLFSEDCEEDDYPYWKINSTVQIEKCVVTYKQLREFTDLSECTADSTLKLLAEHCPYLRKLNIPCCTVSDRGVAYLFSSGAATKGLCEINLCGTPVSPEGTEMAIKSLPCLRKMECSSIKASAQIFSSLILQNLEFKNMKWLSWYTTDSTLEHFTTGNFDGLATLFPNLEFVTFYITLNIKCFQFLSLLKYLTDINLVCLDSEQDDVWEMLTCTANITFQMKTVTKLSLSNFQNVCPIFVLRLWPNVECISMKNLFCCTRNHEEYREKYGLGLRHLALKNTSIPKQFFFKCFSKVQTIAVVKSDFMQIFRTDEIGSYSTHQCDLAQITVDCHDTPFDIPFGKWLILHCTKLKLINMSEQQNDTDAIKWLAFQRPQIRLTFFKIAHKHEWFLDEVFTPCTLCQVYKTNQMN